MVLAGMKTVSSHFVHELQGIVMTGTESFTGDDISSKYEWPEAECVCVCVCVCMYSHTFRYLRSDKLTINP